MERLLKITSITFSDDKLKEYKKAYEKSFSNLKSEMTYENKIPFVFLGVAFLEYYVNNAIINFNDTELPREYSQKYANYYLSSLSLKAKVELLPSILSYNKLVLNPSNKNVQEIFRLISMRNKITHKKDYPISLDIEHTKDGAAKVTIPKEEDPLNSISEKTIDCINSSIINYIDECCVKDSKYLKVAESSMIIKLK